MDNSKYSCFLDEVKKYIKPTNKVENVYIHIGFHKTATTSIQNVLFEKSDLLKNEDYFYPKSIGRNHGRFIRTLVTDEPMKIYDNIGKNKDVVKNEIINLINDFNSEISTSGSKNIIISGEDLSFFNQKEVQKLKTFTELYFKKSNTFIVVSTRETKSFIQSDYQQAIKMGYDIKLNNVIKYNSTIFRNRLSSFLEVFTAKNIIVYKYEDACEYKGGVIKYFAKSVSLNENIFDDSHISFSNISLSDKAMELLVFINEKEPLINGLKRNKKRTSSDVISLLNLKGDKYVIESSLFKDFYKEIYNDKKWLFDKLSIDYINVRESELNEKEIKYDLDYIINLSNIMGKSNYIISNLMKEFIDNKISIEDKNKNIFTVLKIIAENNCKLKRIEEIIQK